MKHIILILMVLIFIYPVSAITIFEDDINRINNDSLGSSYYEEANYYSVHDNKLHFNISHDGASVIVTAISLTSANYTINFTYYDLNETVTNDRLNIAFYVESYTDNVNSNIIQFREDNTGVLAYTGAMGYLGAVSSVGLTLVNNTRYSISLNGDNASITQNNSFLTYIDLWADTHNSGTIAFSGKGTFTDNLKALGNLSVYNDTAADTCTPTITSNATHYDPDNLTHNLIFDLNRTSCVDFVNITYTGNDSSTYYLLNSTDVQMGTGQEATYEGQNVSWNLSSSILVNGTYHINETLAPAPIIYLESMTPEINQSTTGYVNLTFLVETGVSGLNNSSISLIWKAQHIDGFENWSYRWQTNKSPDGWRADNRNNSVNSLNFEIHITITNGTIYEYAGCDENCTRVSIVEINGTHSYVYLNGTVQNLIHTNSHYIDRTAMQEATKTVFQIYRNNDAVFKVFDPESDIGHDHIVGLWIDSAAFTGLDATDSLNLWVADSTWNPEGAVDITSIGDFVTSWNATTWLDYECSTDNSSYVVVYFNTTNLTSNLTDNGVFYAVLKSLTPAAKSYNLNTSNVATDTNVSFADLGVMWYGSTTPYTTNPYTPSVFLEAYHDNMQWYVQLWGADNNGNWGNSTMNITDIDVSTFPPTTPGICSFYYNNAIDYDMNGTYSGEYYVRVLTSSDPDGGIPTSNLTLHYKNETLVATINGSIPGNGGGCVNVTFDSTPYYSGTEEYTLRVITTDDESNTSEYWLPVNFTLLNTAPTLTGIPDRNTNEDNDLLATFDLDDYYYDADGDSPTFSVQSNNQSGNVTVDINAGNTVDFILDANWHGVAEIVFNVSDGFGGTANDTIILTVASVNDNPILEYIGPKNINELEELIIDLESTDVDGDTPEYSCNRTDLFTDFDNVSGIGTWTPNSTSAGVYSVIFTVEDGNGGSDFEVVYITVNDLITIDSYWNNQTGDSLSLSVVPGSTVEFSVTTSIIADNISWYNGSTFLENDTTTSQGNLTYQFDSEGVFEINVSALNGSAWTSNTTFMVTVWSVNLSGYIINRIALPVENARIDINGDFVYTDSAGYYEVAGIIPGEHDITVKAIAYGNKYDALNLTNDSVSNYTLMERTSPSTVPGLGILTGLIILSLAVFRIRKGKTIIKH